MSVGVCCLQRDFYGRHLIEKVKDQLQQTVRQDETGTHVRISSKLHDGSYEKKVHSWEKIDAQEEYRYIEYVSQQIFYMLGKEHRETKIVSCIQQYPSGDEEHFFVGHLLCFNPERTYRPIDNLVSMSRNEAALSVKRVQDIDRTLRPLLEQKGFVWQERITTIDELETKAKIPVREILLSLPSHIQILNLPKLPASPIPIVHAALGERLLQERAHGDSYFICCDGKKVFAHKCVLDLSPYFKELFTKKNKKGPSGVAEMPSISSSTMEALLYYLYTSKNPFEHPAFAKTDLCEMLDVAWRDKQWRDLFNMAVYTTIEKFRFAVNVDEKTRKFLEEMAKISGNSALRELHAYLSLLNQRIFLEKTGV